MCQGAERLLHFRSLFTSSQAFPVACSRGSGLLPYPVLVRRVCQARNAPVVFRKLLLFFCSECCEYRSLPGAHHRPSPTSRSWLPPSDVPSFVVVGLVSLLPQHVLLSRGDQGAILYFLLRHLLSTCRPSIHLECISVTVSWRDLNISLSICLALVSSPVISASILPARLETPPSSTNRLSPLWLLPHDGLAVFAGSLCSLT